MELLLGRDATFTPITVSTPTILHCLGPANVGRNEFMIELARQAIDSGACIIYVTDQSDPSTWAKIYSAAENAERQNECFAKSSVSPGLLEVSISGIVSQGAILCYRRSFSENADEFQQFLDDLVHAVSQRILINKPIIVIFDDLHEVPVQLRELFAHADSANVSCVLGDPDAKFVDQVLPSVSIDLRVGGVGEAVVLIPTDKDLLTHKIKLAHEHIDLAKKLVPANFVIKAY